MATFISFEPIAYYNTTIYDGTGATQTITGTGFSSDFTWIKNRDSAVNHNLVDTVRGYNKYIYPNLTSTATATDRLTSWTSDGFVLGSSTEVNTSGQEQVAFNLKAGTTSGITTDGSTTITPSSYSFSQTAGISIIKYTGNNTAGAKLAHGLGAVPKFMMFKNLNTTDGWVVYHDVLGATKYLALNTTAAASAYTDNWNDTSPDSVNITLGTSSETNTVHDFVAYVFADKQGFSRFGSYVGNGNNNGPCIYTGFQPGFLMIKNTTATEDWDLYNDKCDGYQEDNRAVHPNNTDAEKHEPMNLLANGFKFRDTDANINTNDVIYIYAAFAYSPMVSVTDVPNTARGMQRGGSYVV